MKTVRLSTVAATTSLLALSLWRKSVSQATAVPTQIDPTVFVNQFEATSGKYEGCRRSDAKGICAIDEFVTTPDAKALSTASVVSGKPIPVVVRFSVGGSTPKAPDNAKTQRKACRA